MPQHVLAVTNSTTVPIKTMHKTQAISCASAYEMPQQRLKNGASAGEDRQEGFSHEDALCSASSLQSLAMSDPHRAAALVQRALDSLAGLSRLLLDRILIAAQARGASARRADVASELPTQVIEGVSFAWSLPCSFATSISQNTCCLAMHDLFMPSWNSCSLKHPL